MRWFLPGLLSTGQSRFNLNMEKKDTYTPNVQFLLEFVLYAIANLTHSCLAVPEEIVFSIFDT